MKRCESMTNIWALRPDLVPWSGAAELKCLVARRADGA